MIKTVKLSVLTVVLCIFTYGKLFSQDLLISGGNTVSSVICANGFVYTWGKNSQGTPSVTGTLGNGSTAAQVNSPAKVNFPTDDPYFVALGQGITVKAVDAGSGGHFIALDCYSGAWSWGNHGGSMGITGTGSTAGAIATPARVLRGQTPGGASIHPTLANYLVDVKYISGGNNNSYAILNSGEAVAWGDNTSGQVGNGTNINAATPQYILTGPGTRLQNVIQIEAGDATGYALVDPDGDGYGTVYSWGQGANGRLGRNAAGTGNSGTETADDNYARPVLNLDGTPLTNIRSISAGDVMCFAIDDNGYMWAWGNGGWGGSTGTGVSGLSNSNPMRVVAGEWGTTPGAGFGQTYLQVKSIAGGQGYGMAVTIDGVPMAWGNDEACTASTPGGNLGNGPGGASIVPSIIRRSGAAGDYNKDVISISDGDTWGFYTTASGQIYTWGSNDLGQLGLGNTTCAPYAVPFSLTCTPPAPKPTANLIPRDMTVCASGFTGTILNSQFVVGAALAPGYRITWYRNGTQVKQGLASVAGNLTYNVASGAAGLGTYKVVIEYIGADAPCEQYAPVSDQITISAFTQNYTIPTPLTFCDNLNPYVNGQGVYHWYKNATGGTPLDTTLKNGMASIPKASVNAPSAGVYTVYVEESGQYAGNFGKVNPNTGCTNITTRNLWDVRNTVFTMSTPSVVVDTLSFWAKADGQTHSIELNIFDTRIHNNNIISDNIIHTTAPRSITLPSGGAWVEVKIPVNYTLSGGPGVSYAIGFKNGAGNIQIADFNCNYVGRTDDIATGGPYLTSTGAERNTNYSAAWGSISNVRFHTPQGFCDRIPVTLTEVCPCRPPAGVSLIPSTDTTLCEGSSLTIEGTADIAGLTPINGGYYYRWYKGTTPVTAYSTTYADLSFASLATTDAATYTLRVEDGTAESSACYLEASVTVEVNATTIPGAIAADQTICDGNTPAALTSTSAASGGDGATYNYQWQSSADNVTFTDIATAGTSAGYAPGLLTQTTYYRRSVTSGSACPTVYSDTVTITIIPALTAGAVGADQTICSSNSPAILTETVAATGGTGTYDYQWQSSADGTTGWTNILAATDATYAPPSLTATTYYRRVVSSGTCTPENSNVITITILPGLNAGTITADQSICYNTTPAALASTAAASGGTGTYTYSWQESTDAGTTWNTIGGETGLGYTPPTLTATAQYRRVVVSGTGTCNTANTTPVTITVYADLTEGAIGSDQTICSGAAPALLTDASSPTGGTGSYTYSWQESTDGGTTWNAVSGAAASTYAPPALTATTLYRRTVTSGSCGSLTTSPVTITVTPNTPVSVTINDPGATCAGALMSFTATPLNPGNSPTYAWYVNDVPAGTNAPTFSSSSLTNGNTVKVVLTSSITCTTGSPATSNVVTVSVLSNVTPAITISDPQKICVGSSVTFTTLSSSGGGATPSYQWYLNGSPVGTNSDTYTNGSLTNGNTVHVVMTSSLSCATSPTATSNIVTMNVVPVPDPQIIGSDTTFCSGGSVTFSSVNGGGALTWNNGGSPISGAQGSTFNVQSSGTYTLTENNGACATTSAPVTVLVLPTPVVDAGPDQYVIDGTLVTLNATGAVNYLWTPSTGLSDASVPNPTFVANNTITFTVEGHDATNACSSTDVVTIFVEKPIIIPNAFSPNGDGNNESWEIANMETHPNCEVEVFNRWGTLVWKSTGYTLQWNGSNYRNGEVLPEGTYFYIIDLKSQIYTKPYTGYVQILK